MAAGIRTGQQFGAYTLGDLIGRGGMGVVYRAEHVHLGRMVALKLLAPELTESADFRERFLRESRAAAELDHPNVVTVYDAGEVDGVLYIAMRHVQGEDLQALLRREAPLSPERTVSVIAQVGSALDAAHERGLVHRDVKPANVMIEGVRSYLTDFGLTKRTSTTVASLTSTGQFVGTVDYMAPEQIEGRSVDGRVDIYALGCVLHECLTGARPYPRDSDVAVVYAHLQEPPPRPSVLRPGLPPAVDDVVATAMAKRAEDRYPTCELLVHALTEALGVGDGRATQPPGGGPPTRPAGERITSATEPSPAAPATAGSAAAASTAGPAGAPPAVPQSPGPPTPPERPREGDAPRVYGRRRSRLPFVLAAIAVVAAVAIAIAVSSGGGGSGTKTGAAGAAPHVVGSPIKVGRRPFGVTVGPKIIWVANNDDATVTRIGTDGSGPRTDVSVGRQPFGIAQNTRSIWVANSGDGSVTKIDKTTGRAHGPFRVGASPFFVAADDISVYVSNGGDNTVSVLDARTGSPLTPPIKVGNGPRGIASTGSAVWVANRNDGTVDRIVAGRVVRTFRVGLHPVGVVVGGGAVWVTNKDSDSVTRIALQPGAKRIETIPVGHQPFGVAFGLGFVWVADSGSGDVLRLDPATGKRVGNPIAVPGQPVGVAVGERVVWVSENNRNALIRIAP